MLKLSITIFLSACFLSAPIQAYAENLVDEKVIVSASRSPITFNQLSRSVEVLDAKEISRLPVNNVQDLITYIAGVDSRARGILGVQADVSIRGSSFEQVLVLVDGVKMNNAQTGHFNLNLPLTLKDIERIEILKGAGSRVFGSGAFAGVINIITKRKGSNSITMSLTGGEYGFYDADVSASLKVGKRLTESVSFQNSSSEGFTYNTDFNITTARLNSLLKTTAGDVSMSIAKTDREYGANSFYSDKYRNQWEDTSTTLLNAGADLMFDGILFLPKVYWTSSTDVFLLDRYNDDLYRNESSFDRYGAEIQISCETSFGTASLGVEYCEEILSSIASGDHSRDGLTFFAEQQLSLLDNLNVIFGASAYLDSSENDELSPGIDISCQPLKDLNLYASANKAFRLPSFTELYYVDPVHRGNTALSPETAWTYEIGGRFNLDLISVALSYSRIAGREMIDWVRANAVSVWETKNIRDSRFDSYEISVQCPGGDLNVRDNCFRINGSYSYTYGKKFDFALESKYVFDYLKHKASISSYFPVFGFADAVFVSRYEERLGREGIFIMDASFSKEIDFCRISIQAKNLFDVEYQDIGSVPMPGRWIFVTLCFSLDDDES